MAANKRRKLNALDESKNISAFAARRQLQIAHDGYENSSETTFKTDETLVISEEGQLFNSGSILGSGVVIQKSEGGIGQELDQGSEDDTADSENISDNQEEDDELTKVISRRKPREAEHLHPSNQSWTHFTTVSLNKDSAERLKDGSIRVRIAPGEKLVVLGEYRLSVLRGQITILGAILSSSRSIHDVCASSSHSLPVIRCLKSNTEKAEIVLHESKSKLRSLKQLSPVFAGLWSASSDRLGASDKTGPKSWGLRGNSFQILPTQDEDPRMGYHPTVSPPEWNEALSISASERSKHGSAFVTMICGPKSSGKSTFSRLLTNRLLTTSSTQEIDSHIAFLDLDPGQPEFSPPGQLSLHLLSKPNFGPPFAHPDGLASGTKIIRAHSIAAVSPSSDPDFYSTCATDLFSHYVDVLLPMHCPLVINTPGWILGTGLELLISLVKIVRPTRVIYMSQDGPREAVESLQDAVKSSPVLTLPSQPTEYLPRTSAHLRTMQYMSYFHQDTMGSGDRVWNSDPVTLLVPLEVSYTGKAAGILGIMCLGEQPSIEMVRDTIDGSIVALVVIEDMAAILSSKGNEKIEGSIEVQPGEDISMDNNSEEVGRSHFTDQPYRGLEDHLILHTPEGIPYLNPANTTGLNPTYSHTIGLALVRGIDVRRQRLQLLTPISLNTIKDIRASGKVIILVSGKLDTPGWAYLEALYKKDAHMKEDAEQHESGERSQESGDKGVNALTDGQQDHGNGFENAPWIEVLRGDKGRDVGARVWRVRRDLGKIGDGG